MTPAGVRPQAGRVNWREWERPHDEGEEGNMAVRVLWRREGGREGEVSSEGMDRVREERRRMHGVMERGRQLTQKLSAQEGVMVDGKKGRYTSRRGRYMNREGRSTAWERGRVNCEGERGHSRGGRKTGQWGSRLLSRLAGVFMGQLSG